MHAPLTHTSQSTESPRMRMGSVLLCLMAMLAMPCQIICCCSLAGSAWMELWRQWRRRVLQVLHNAKDRAVILPAQQSYGALLQTLPLRHCFGMTCMHTAPGLVNICSFCICFEAHTFFFCSYTKYLFASLSCHGRPHAC